LTFFDARAVPKAAPIGAAIGDSGIRNGAPSPACDAVADQFHQPAAPRTGGVLDMIGRESGTGLVAGLLRLAAVVVFITSTLGKWCLGAANGGGREPAALHFLAHVLKMPPLIGSGMLTELGGSLLEPWRPTLALLCLCRSRIETGPLSRPETDHLLPNIFRHKCRSLCGWGIVAKNVAPRWPARDRESGSV